jgi:feruloyl esterase
MRPCQRSTTPRSHLFGSKPELASELSGACDDLDGLKDGVISNIHACAKTFDAKVLRCESGKNTGNDCLSDLEIAVIKAIYAPCELGFPIAKAVTSFPSWGGYGGYTQPGGMNAYIAGPKPPAFPPLSQSEQDSSI